MSILTKVFVGLLVFLSVALAAAAVTFLNTLPTYQSDIANLTTRNSAAQAEVSRLQTDSAAAVAAERNRTAAAETALGQARASSSELRQQNTTLRAQIADLQAQMAQNQTAMTAMSGAVQASQTTVQQLREQVGQLRQGYDRTLQQYTETAQALARTQNELTFTERALRNAQEQNQELLSRVDTLNGFIADSGLRAPNPGEVAGLRGGAPAINGTVTARNNIEGIAYAMISVGSEDDVLPGMQFTVLDPNSGDFLGFLTIERVDDTQSIGRLSGPRVEQINSGARVITQFNS